MAEMFVHETSSLIEQLENKIIESERDNSIDIAMDEIFRVMHTIKGNSMMMNYDGIAKTSHALEDLFEYIRAEKPQNMDFAEITNLVLETVDYIKGELDLIEAEEETTSNDALVTKIKVKLDSLKGSTSSSKKVGNTGSVVSQDYSDEILGLINEDDTHYYECSLYYEEDTEMVNIRAFSVINQLEELCIDVASTPSDLENLESNREIELNGLFLVFSSKSKYDEISDFFTRAPFISQLNLNEIGKEAYLELIGIQEKQVEAEVSRGKAAKSKTVRKNQTEQNFISVKVDKLDSLMNLVSELVVAESMVSRNPDLNGLELDNFNKSVKQMRKVVNDLQDVVMEVRMVPLALTFLKMNRLVRDMAIKINKKVELELIGQNTEVDKSIIEQISDPLMHLIRNAVDHGIELPEERVKNNKPEKGLVQLEAKREGGEVHIIIRDDGQGMNRERILEKAEQRGLLFKEREAYTDEEIYEFIFQPGFSTNEEATDFSGRGVGMDVVAKAIERIGGKIQVESQVHKGTTITIRIPLTLAIIDCILVEVGKMKYGIPINSVNQLIKAEKDDLVKDPQGHQMIMYGNKCLEIKRTYKSREIDDSSIFDGILVYLENNEKGACLLVDEVLGEYQLVVKKFPNFISKVKGLSGCALLGDGNICMIVDPAETLN
jgi:two-component system chemotaxis sensor kinase CheA